MTQQNVWDAGGPSDTTQSGIELGTATGVQRSTLLRLEKALQWAPGSARIIMEGGEPTPIERYREESGPAPGRDLHEQLASLAGRITSLSAQLRDIAQTQKDLRPLAAESDELARMALVLTVGELVGNEQGSAIAAPLRRWATSARDDSAAADPMSDVYRPDGSINPSGTQMRDEDEDFMEGLAEDRHRSRRTE
ncbi:hypothetical protein [Nocardia fusca]|uniref:Uncharacterized protein n=1 Tax=Nocardia fusca TaxID=941183 RepID=A0ABV3FJ97_9NOCA